MKYHFKDTITSLVQSLVQLFQLYSMPLFNRATSVELKFTSHELRSLFQIFGRLSVSYNTGRLPFFTVYQF